MENQEQTFKTLAEVEKEHLEKALEAAGGNKAKAAKLLGVSIKTVYNKLNNYYKKEAEQSTETPSTESEQA